LTEFDEEQRVEGGKEEKRDKGRRGGELTTASEVQQ
jgi:hypothetical protein